MNVVFFGTTDTGWHCLDAMCKAHLSVRGIVTGLQEFEISYAKDKVRNLRHHSFQNFQEQRGIPLLTFERAFDEKIVQTLTRWRPHLFVVIGWYHLIPRRVRELAPLGTVGIHWSLLPKYRGGSPLVWAILHGEHETGASLFYLEDKVDTGDIVAQEKIRIAEHEEVGDLINTLNVLSGKMVVEHIPKILGGTAARWQQDNSAATYFPPRSPQDGEIDWSWSGRRVYDFIRAQSPPYPCAFSYYHGRKINVVKATMQPVAGFHVCVRTGTGDRVGLEKILVESENKAIMAREYFRDDEIVFEGHV